VTQRDGAPRLPGPHQLELLRAQVRGKRPKPPAAVADTDPVASVVLDVPLPHLDRPFDYAVPATMADTAVPGARVRIRFAGQDADGFVVRRSASSEHPGPLTPLRAAPSAEVVLQPAVHRAARAVADHYAGTLADVLRLAVPPRHAATEAVPSPDAPPPPPTPRPGPWRAYRGGQAFLSRVAQGSGPRAVWTALPGRGADDWAHALAVAAATALVAGRGSVLVLPDHRDVVRVDDALTALLGSGHHVRLTADVGPAARYAAFLQLSRGSTRIAVGTRAAAFAPVHDLGLVVCWDDGDDLLTEPRAPYPHYLRVLAIRAEQTGAAALFGSLSRSTQAQQLVDDGWARPVVADRSEVRRRAPRVLVTGDDETRDPAARAARMPSQAMRAVREGLATGPVLVQVPRAGYVPALACQSCRSPARCASCSGPLAVSTGSGPPVCRWCGQLAGAWSCSRCGNGRLRSVVVGAARTVEELGRAFPGTTVRASGGDLPVLPRVGDGRDLVVTTPGAEPVAEDGYAAAVLLDTWAPLGRPDLLAAEEALRRWLTAAALVRPAEQGGQVVVVGDASLAPIQALVRWDPAGHAQRELAERTELALPPSVALAEVVGDGASVRALLSGLRLPEQADLLGPLPVDVPARSRVGPDSQQLRALVRAPRSRAGELATALTAARVVLSSGKQARPPRVQVDPARVG
jgi:primosomal protein N' (replication factor Y) (superfamily II helicase)